MLPLLNDKINEFVELIEDPEVKKMLAEHPKPVHKEDTKESKVYEKVLRDADRSDRELGEHQQGAYSWFKH